MSKKRGQKKRYKNFEEFGKKIKDIEGLVPETFAKVAKKAGIKFVNEAKEITDREGLVDTGSYKRNWTADIGIIGKGKAFIVKCFNPMEYASFLEYGHRTKSNGKTKGYFVGAKALENAREFAINELNLEFGDLFEK